MTRLYYSLILLLVGYVYLAGCATSRNGTTNASSAVQRSLLEQEEEWLGTPFQRGGNSKRGIDASALVMHVYGAAFNLSLPRTTMEQVDAGKEVAKKDLQTGDLLFFQPSPSDRHVGIYMGNGEFLHASPDYGVILSRLNEIHWQNTYWTARRVLPDNPAVTNPKTPTPHTPARRTGW